MGRGALEVTNKLWTGEISVEEVHPVAVNSDLDEVAPGVAFITAWLAIAAPADPLKLFLWSLTFSASAAISSRR